MHAPFEFWKNSLGYYFRLARERRGYSLRDVEKLSGVSNAQVLRIEKGDFNCALDTFVRICCALGLPFASVLEQVISPQASSFWKGLDGNQKLQPILEAAGADTEAKRRWALLFLQSLAAEVARLMYSDDPVARAQECQTKSSETKTALMEFARTLARPIPAQYRRVVVENLECAAFTELQRLGLLNQDSAIRILAGAITTMQAGSEWIGPMPVNFPDWLPADDGDGWIAREFGGTELRVDKLADMQERPAMPYTLSSLLERARVVSEGHGKQGELATVLGVHPSQLSRWLNGKGKPNAEATLLLLNWVSSEEAKDAANAARSKATPKKRVRK